MAESTLRFAERNYVWGRIENVDRTSELLLRNIPEPPNFSENILGRVQAYTGGYARDVDLIPHLATAIGGQLTLYSTPDSLKAFYGAAPVGAVVFLRVRPFGKKDRWHMQHRHDHHNHGHESVGTEEPVEAGNPQHPEQQPAA